MNIPGSGLGRERLTKYWSGVMDLVTKLIISATPRSVSDTRMHPNNGQIWTHLTS